MRVLSYDVKHPISPNSVNWYPYSLQNFAAIFSTRSRYAPIASHINDSGQKSFGNFLSSNTHANGDGGGDGGDDHGENEGEKEEEDDNEPVLTKTISGSILKTFFLSGMIVKYNFSG
jgi:hypothetical protein